MSDSMPGGSSSFAFVDPGRRSPAPSPAPVFGSPTSTIDVPPASVPLSMPMRAVPTTEPLPTKRRIIIRTDPTLVTCFDPADKELHDLWTPKP